jgi:hypothetical protein
VIDDYLAVDPRQVFDAAPAMPAAGASR